MTTIYGNKNNIRGYSGYRENVSMWNAITNFLRGNGIKCLGDGQGILYETSDGKLYKLR